MRDSMLVLPLRSRTIALIGGHGCATGGGWWPRGREEEQMMSLLTWVVVGLIAGLLADLVVPGKQNWLVDTLVGMAGAIVGGWLFSAFGGAPATGFNPWSILVAFIGAVVVLLLVKAFQARAI